MESEKGKSELTAKSTKGVKGNVGLQGCAGMDRFQRITDEMHKLYLKKNKDYGNSFSRSFEEYGLVMPCIRLEDKLSRLKSMVQNGSLEVKDESVRDTLIDLANYAVMTIQEMDIAKQNERVLDGLKGE